MRLKTREVRLQDKALFERYLCFYEHSLSAYSFENIYIWKELFEIRWAFVEGALCIFFKDAIGCFLYLPPLCRMPASLPLQKIFSVLDSFNTNPAFSHIENVEGNNLAPFSGKGYRIKEKGVEYLCRRKDLADLKGDAFKSKRATVNYFTSHTHDVLYHMYSPGQRDACLRLYETWMEERQKGHSDPLYRAMLKDNYSALQLLLKHYRHFKCLGRVVKIGGRIEAFTFAFALNRNTLCVAYEIANLDYKGLAQFIFRQLCREFGAYEYINIMDDSGLENLRRVKLSYRPVQCVPSFIVSRNNG